MAELDEFMAEASAGEESFHQFKAVISDNESLCAEIVAFANARGGRIYLGVNDRGDWVGLDPEEFRDCNQRIANVASQMIRNPLAVLTRNVGLDNGRVVIIIEVPEGVAKPYFDRNGVIWIKEGADKRKVCSREEILRLFQSSAQLHADECATTASVDRLDKTRLDAFLRQHRGIRLPANRADYWTLLRNLNLVSEDGHLNLAGVLLFGEEPQNVKPAFVIKAVHFIGNSLTATRYLDSTDISGSLDAMYEQAMTFIARNLRRVQGRSGVNSQGTLEIPSGVFEEILVNALVHRDYTIDAPIQVLVFDNRIEVTSPGYLPNHLTVEKIKMGNTVMRNPILASFASMGMLPYRGLGSGIRRALSLWRDIDFENDINRAVFTVTVRRKELTTELKDWAYRQPMADPVFEMLQAHPDASAMELAVYLGLSERTVQRRLALLKSEGRIAYVGSKKTGRWVLQR